MVAGRGMHIITVYDRLWHNSGFVGNVTTVQTIPAAPALTRPEAGAAGHLWLEVYTALGATAATITALYTNQSGIAGRTATAAYPGGTVHATSMLPFVLQSGDVAVQSVQSVQLSTDTTVAGNWGLVIVRDLLDVSVGMEGMGEVVSYFRGGAPEIQNDACLAFRLQISSTGTTGDVIGGLTLLQG